VQVHGRAPGVRGAVVKLTPAFSEVRREGDHLVAGAGAKLAALITRAAHAFQPSNSR
jgi:hypothetical protein